MGNNVAILRLRWLMLAVILFDGLITLAGQPSTYWRQPGTAIESNPVVRAIMHQGIIAFALASALYGACAFSLVTKLPQRPAFITLLLIILCHYFGASSWFWRFNLPYGELAYAGVLASLLVHLGVGVAELKEQPARWPSILSGAIAIGAVIACAMLNRTAATIVSARTLTEGRMNMLKSRVILYARIKDQLPDTLEVLSKAFRANPTIDGWMRPIGYEVDSAGVVTFRSFGHDGVPGGSGDDRDIVRTFPSRDSRGEWNDNTIPWALDTLAR